MQSQYKQRFLESWDYTDRKAPLDEKALGLQNASTVEDFSRRVKAKSREGACRCAASVLFAAPTINNPVTNRPFVSHSTACGNWAW